VKNLFLKAFAGTSVGRSTNATKNSFSTKKDFRFNRGYGIANVNTYIVSNIFSPLIAVKDIRKSNRCLKSQTLIHYLQHTLRQPAARKANPRAPCVKNQPTSIKLSWFDVKKPLKLLEIHRHRL